MMQCQPLVTAIYGQCGQCSLRHDAMSASCDSHLYMGNVGNATLVEYSNNWISPSVQRSLRKLTVVTLCLLWYQRQKTSNKVCKILCVSAVVYVVSDHKESIRRGHL